MTRRNNGPLQLQLLGLQIIHHPSSFNRKPQLLMSAKPRSLSRRERWTRKHPKSTERNRDNELAAPQHELTVGAVNITNQVERSSTASNADGRATRSASTASEVFSHQSSRLSTNNTSRSSVNPAAGNPKTTSVHVSSVVTSSSVSGNVLLFNPYAYPVISQKLLKRG